MKLCPRKAWAWKACTWLTVIFFFMSFLSPASLSEPLSSPAVAGSPVSMLTAKRVLANAGPSYWQGYPSSAILAVDRDCPIAIEHEQLVFDLTEESGYSIQGQVRATYEMVNPTDQDLSVQMAFPIVSTVSELSAEDITIMADGTPVDYEIFLGDTLLGENYPRNEEIRWDFEQVLSSITREAYQPKNFSQDEIVRVYTIDAQPLAGAENLYIGIRFERDETKTKMMSKGFNVYQGTATGYAMIGAWCGEPRTLEIVVFGEEQPEFKISGYENGALQQESDQLAYEMTHRDVELREYLMGLRAEREYSVFWQLREADFYNYYARVLDRELTRNGGYSVYEELFSEDYQERVITLVYTVDFPANSTKNVTVGYKTRGTMDKTKTMKPVYTFNYLLNPAQHWSSFGDLTVEVFTPEEAPYIVDSNIQFTETGTRHYTATLDSLPEGDLSFSLYQDQEISAIDRLLPGNTVYSILVFAHLFGKPFLFIAAVVLGGLLIRKYLLKK